MAVKKTELYSALWQACDQLRDGVEPVKYKDYVLILLFFKYVSDKYRNTKHGGIKVGKGYSFDDLIEAAHKEDVCDRVDEVINKFREINRLDDALPKVKFNTPEDLGNKLEERIDKVSSLIEIFRDPRLNFETNMASGDDIIGDAYEYLMMKFAQGSGKSKGQFYTPGEVSRIIARLIGIGDIKQNSNYKWKIYDPAAGSGSLLIRAVDEAPVDRNNNPVVTIYGQEKEPSTAGMAKMNLIVHQKITAEIKSGNTLSSPAFTPNSGELEKFDFIVMNPPFSDKAWTLGIKPSDDEFGRFDGYGIPPEKNGDYAWFLHVLKSLKDKGKAGIIMPHGVLFRGNVEEIIRIEILKKKYIKCIVSLPPNLFYGTGIPACIIIIDKENAATSKGIFLINASRGFRKNGSKNQLREQDIEKIVRTFNNQDEIVGYSRFVKYEEILGPNGGNLNIPRYIQEIDDTLRQNIDSHLKGGIPAADVDSLKKLWEISPSLKQKIFKHMDKGRDVYKIVIDHDTIENTISQDSNIIDEKKEETVVLFNQWKAAAKNMLLGINENTNPKAMIRTLGGNLLEAYGDARLIDKYDAYDCLLNYWNESLQDDVYFIKASGYVGGQEIKNEYARKKVKNDRGKNTYIEDKTKIKSFDGVLIPMDIIEKIYFPDELAEINLLLEESAALEAELDEMAEEEACDDGLLENAVNGDTGNITKEKLVARLKELELEKTSAAMEQLKKLLKYFDEGQTEKMEKLLHDTPELGVFDLTNKNGKFGKSNRKIKKAIESAAKTAVIPEVYRDEYENLCKYAEKLDKKGEADKKEKELRKTLNEKVKMKYAELSEDEIKHLLFDMKWMHKLETDITDEVNRVLNSLSSRALLIEKRYRYTLGEIEDKTSKSREAVKVALERMGYKC